MGFWQFGDRLLLDVYVPLSFATTVDMHIWVNRSANPSVSLETTRNNSKLFRQGLWSHLLHRLILVRAAAYWQLSHLLPADVRDALAGHDELQVVHAQQGLDAGLAATALHSGTPSCPPILVRRTQRLLRAVKLAVTSCHKVSPTSQTWQQNQEPKMMTCVWIQSATTEPLGTDHFLETLPANLLGLGFHCPNNYRGSTQGNSRNRHSLRLSPW